MSSSLDSLRVSQSRCVVSLIPLPEGKSVYLEDAGLQRGLCSNQLVVGGVIELLQIGLVPAIDPGKQQLLCLWDTSTILTGRLLYR